MVVDQRGKLLHTVALESGPRENPAEWCELTCVGPEKFLLLRTASSDKHKMEAAVVDVAAGKTTPVAGFTTSVLSKVAGFADGGFALVGGLLYFRGGATGDHHLRCFDGGGKLLWFVPGMGDEKDPAALFHPTNVAVTTDGKIAVIDVSRKLVQFCDRADRHHHTVDLKKAWGREPHYPSDISADRDGGVLVHDFRGSVPIVRMNADGTVRAEVRPRLKNGAAIHLSDAQVAPDGVLWVSDGHAVYRLIESGVAGRVLGEAPDPQRFDEVAAVTLDRKGNIYAVVRRTGAVHVFAPDGRWLRVCRPDAGDISGDGHASNLTVSDSGDVYLGLGMFEEHKYLHFAPDGKRIDIETSKLDEISEEWYAQPGTKGRWVLGYQKVYLIAGNGAVARTIMRRADGFWLEDPHTASVAADGSIAILSISGGVRLHGGELAVSLYSPQGEPIRTFALPSSVKWSFPRIAYDGKRVVVAEAKAIVLFDASGKTVGRFTPPDGERAAWTPFLAPDGRGLLLFDGAKTLRLFELP